MRALQHRRVTAAVAAAAQAAGRPPQLTSQMWTCVAVAPRVMISRLRVQVGRGQGASLRRRPQPPVRCGIMHSRGRDPGARDSPAEAVHFGESDGMHVSTIRLV